MVSEMPDLFTALTLNDNQLMNDVLADTDVSGDEGVIAVMKSVCEDINTLTFNRITDFFALTQFQRDTLLRVCARFLQFKVDNADLLACTLSSYGINGVSMSFNPGAVMDISGVKIPADVYALLRQTGLTCLRL